MVSSRVYPGLERKPGGPDNWVEKAGGLPDYIERIAKHLHYEKGMTISRAIAVAVNTVKRWALGGTVTEHGTTKRISAKTQALAAKAVAEWEAKKKAGSVNLSDTELWLIDLSMIPEAYPWDLLDLAEADISKTDTMVALMLDPTVAKKIAVEGGTAPEDMHVTVTFHGETTDEQYTKLCQDLKDWAADMPNDTTLEGQIGGIGSFPAKDPEKGTPWFAPVDIPGLNTIHEQVKAVADRSAPANTDHGYTPHTTLTFAKDGEEPPSPVPTTSVKFSSLHVVRGNTQREEIPLTKQTSVDKTRRDTLRGMDTQTLASRANAVTNPAARKEAQRKVRDLAVPKSKLTAAARRKAAASGAAMPDGSFPITDANSLRSAIRLARTPAQRAHVKRRAKSLGLTSMIPDKWKTTDLASTIAPRNAKGRVSDGRKSFKRQGRWGHGFVPLDQAAKEAKAKGSPIAIKRLNRIFGGRTASEGTGRAGGRSAMGRKRNPKNINVREKSSPVGEQAGDIAQLRHSQVAESTNQPETALPKRPLEASKASRIPARARQNWDEIPENLKTVRNGKRYVYAEFDGKGYVTEWLGGVNENTSTPLDKRKVVRSLTSADIEKMSPAQISEMIDNPQTPDDVKRLLRREQKARAAAKVRA